MQFIKSTKFKFNYDMCIVGAFCALVYFLPISIALVESFSGVIVFLFLLKKISQGLRFHNLCSTLIKDFKEPANLIGRVLGLYIGIIFLSVIFSHDVKMSAIAFIGKFLQAVFLYLSFVQSFKNRSAIGWFLFAFLIGGLVISSSGFSQHFTGLDFVRGNVIRDGRITSCLRHSNDFGVYLVLINLMLLALFITWQPSRRKLLVKGALGLMLLLCLTCLMWTYSRGAWMGFIFALILFLMLERKSWPYVVCGFLILYFLFIPSLKSSRNVALVADDTSFNAFQSDHARAPLPVKDKLSAGKPENSVESHQNLVNSLLVEINKFGGSGRAEYWHNAIEVIKYSPLIGVGLNLYSKTVLQIHSAFGGGYPHNCYLQMTAESGLLGLAGFLFLVLVFFIQGFRYAKQIKDVFLKAVIIGGLSGLGGFLVESFFDTTLYSVQLGNLMWLMMGLVVASIAIDRSHLAVIDKK